MFHKWIYLGGLMAIIVAVSYGRQTAKIPHIYAERGQISECTDKEHAFKVVLNIASDGLLACNNNFHGKDTDPLLMDIANPGFNDFLRSWFKSFTPDEQKVLAEDTASMIVIAPKVSDDLVKRVKDAVRYAGIEKVTVSDFGPVLRLKENESRQ